MTEGNAENGAKSGGGFGEFLRSKRGELIIAAGAAALALIFTVISFSIKLTDYYFGNIFRGDMSLWTADFFYLKKELAGGNHTYISNLNAVMIAAFVVCAALYIAAALVLVFKNRRSVFIAAAVYNIILNLLTVILGLALGILRGGAVACGVISALVCVVLLAYLIMRRRQAGESKSEPAPYGLRGGEEQPQPEPLTPEKKKRLGIALFVCSCAMLVTMLSAFFVPLYADGATTAAALTPVRALGAGGPTYLPIIFVVMLIAAFAEILYFTSVVAAFIKADITFTVRSRKLVTGVLIYTLAYFVAGFIAAFVHNMTGSARKTTATTVAYIPLVIAAVGTIVYSVFYGAIRGDNSAIYRINGTIVVQSRTGAKKRARVEPLVYVVIMTAVTFVSLALDIVKVKMSFLGNTTEYALSGYELLSAYKSLEGGFQMLAFTEFAVLLISGIFLTLTIVAFLTRDRNYYKTVKIAAIVNLVFVALIGLFGFYFKIAQKINEENIKSILAYFEAVLPEDSYSYEVDSQTIYMLIAGVAVIAVMMARGMFGLGALKLADPQQSAEAKKRAEMKKKIDAMNKLAEQITATGDGHAQDKPAAEKSEEKPAAASANDGQGAAAPQAAYAAAQNRDDEDKPAPDFDPCPAFTELDGKRPEFDAELAERRLKLFENPTLVGVVRFVVDYARECRLHLSYTPEDIATFVSGMGASRLAILQGMSGTGKTSLPKIFAEAIMGNCEVVEVESSWRDKNELLGYYNEFSRCFTPKKFTQCLYKARLNPSVLTFIVLDEMNLSRIEYYFSDFLSLMEHEEHKREIKLLNIKLHRTEDGRELGYDGLSDGHTIKIPTNVWFIGTANRDESTFEISDKVYDRAQTMNFDRRAPKISAFGAPLDQRFVPYDMLLGLFEDAKKSYAFDAEENRMVQKAEKLLAPYNISFGNRILRQMEDFVKVYCACFGDRAAAEADAVERILLSKVVHKLENKVVENKDKLAAEFDKAGMKRCGEFVRRLNGD